MTNSLLRCHYDFEFDTQAEFGIIADWPDYLDTRPNVGDIIESTDELLTLRVKHVTDWIDDSILILLGL